MQILADRFYDAVLQPYFCRYKLKPLRGYLAFLLYYCSAAFAFLLFLFLIAGVVFLILAEFEQKRSHRKDKNNANEKINS